MSAQRFDGRVLLVTGGASGIGAAIARRFNTEGGRVAILDIDGDRAQQVASCLDDAAAIECNVADEDAVRRAVEHAHTQLGGLHCVVNAAGIAQFGSLGSVTLADWNKMLNVHLTGTFLVCRETIPLLRAAGSGSVVNIASVLALVAREDAAAYSAAKGGIIALSRQLALDAGPDVRVNVIAPGSVRTPMSDRHYGPPEARVRPLPASIQQRIADADEIAAPVCFLLSDEASFVTGTVLVADGGATTA